MSRELLQQALDALQGNWRTDESDKAIEALRARIAQPEPEPVAWKMKGVPAFATSRPNDTDSIKWDALYTAPPQREWVGLRDKEIEDCLEMSIQGTCRAIEAKLKEKNNG